MKRLAGFQKIAGGKSHPLEILSISPLAIAIGI